MKSTQSQPKTSLLDDLIIGVDFDPGNIVPGIVSQANLFLKASGFRVLKMEVRTELENKYDLLKSEKAQEIREDYANRGEKITVDAVKEAVIADPAVKTLRAKLDVAEREEEYAKLLLETYRHRRDSLRMMVDLLKGEQVSMNDSGAIKRDLAEKMHKRFPKGQ